MNVKKEGKTPLNTNKNKRKATFDGRDGSI